ncbi:hypothetical protein FH972_010308 [Carpinus fangiana]|uniref:Uncharacterized protein n=1 Tax=Carpinus fangiana TaxID=176857 RepID=A0A660KPK5_9ROSI|nr:hypothetical protein FH972_010308 [Carpinus fangiana]
MRDLYINTLLAVQNFSFPCGQAVSLLRMKNWEFHYELRPKAGAVNRAMCGLGFQGGRGSQTVIGLALKALVRCLGSFFRQHSIFMTFRIFIHIYYTSICFFSNFCTS